MKNGIVLVLSSLFSMAALANPATLAVRACDDRTPTSLETFVSLRTFSNGNIRVFAVDTGGEPVCCSSHLVIYMPMKDEEMSNKCFHIAADAEGMGFLNVDLANAKASYDPKKGLTLQMTFSFYNDEGDGGYPKAFSILVNQDKQTIKVLK